MNLPQVVVEQTVNRDVNFLADAWSHPETFLFLPSKSIIAEATAIQWLRTLPPNYGEDHFGLLTSGSTGAPKLVIGSRRRSEMLVRTLHEQQDLEKVAECIVTLPLTYSYAFVNQWLWSTVFKRKLLLTRGLADPETLLAALSHCHDAMICLVGAQIPLLLQFFGKTSFEGVIRVNFAGGRFPQEHLHDIEKMFPCAKILNNYGCAEAMPRLAIRAAEASPDAQVIGRPIPGAELSTNDHSHLMFRSVYGAVAVVEAAVPRLLAETEWIPTGDIAEQLADGNWRLLGRTNDVFKRYGEKVSIGNVSSTIASAWRGQYGFYRENDPGGEAGYVLVLATTEQSVLRDVLRALRSSHPRPQWPLRIEGVTTIPLLPNGKVNAGALRDGPGKSILWRQRL